MEQHMKKLILLVLILGNISPCVSQSLMGRYVLSSHMAKMDQFIKQNKKNIIKNNRRIDSLEKRIKKLEECACPKK
jgi:hypothetical protein